MLVATYRDYERPRIISEIRKTCTIFPTPTTRPKLTGDLLVKCGGGGGGGEGGGAWRPRRVQIRAGQLVLLSCRQGDDGTPVRLPLRHLSLRAGPLPHSLALCRGPNVVLTLQTVNEDLFDVWVTSIAIELIRQTPLEAVKYLDILTLDKCWRPKVENKDWNSNCIDDKCNNCQNIDDFEEKRVADLLKKCQNAESYVPVREKLLLFESLGKLGRKVRSTEDVSYRRDPDSTKRARSMHDLTNLNTVREICKYFETKNDEGNNGTNEIYDNTDKRRLIIRVRELTSSNNNKQIL